MKDQKVKYDYSKLRGRIREVYGSEKKFAEALDLSNWTMSQRLNNVVGFKQSEISIACNKLGIPIQNVHEYFLTPITPV